MSSWGLPAYQTYTNTWIMLGTSTAFLSPRCSSTDQTFPDEYKCIVRAVHNKWCQRDWSLPYPVLSRQMTSREALGIARFVNSSFKVRWGWGCKRRSCNLNNSQASELSSILFLSHCLCRIVWVEEVTPAQRGAFQQWNFRIAKLLQMIGYNNRLLYISEDYPTKDPFVR